MSSEYKTILDPPPFDYNSNVHVGWDTNAGNCQERMTGLHSYNDLFKQETVNFISQTVTNYLMPLKGKPIVVPDVQIREMLTSVWNAESGTNYADIYTIQTFDLPWDKNDDSLKRIVLMTIQSIINQIKNPIEVEQINNNLNIWNTLYGDFNEAGLRAHSKIKLREKHPQYMMFNMNY